MQTITPSTPGLPATTAISDPAARAFARAVAETLRAIGSDRFAVEQFTKAAEALAGSNAGTPAGIADWLYKSELYAKLTAQIESVDIEAKQAIIDEHNAWVAAVAAAASGSGTPDYDAGKTYEAKEIVTYGGSLYMASQSTTGNLPTDTDYWDKIGDYDSIGGMIAAHAVKIDDHETRVTNNNDNLAAEVADREALSVALTGKTDPSGDTLETLSSGLIWQERDTRVDAISAVSSTVTGLSSAVGTNSGNIVSEENARVSSDQALVDTINTMWASMGVSNAVSQSGGAVTANWNASQATVWDTIHAEVINPGGDTIRAALATEASARANADGDLYAQYTVKVDINGYVAGFGLAATANDAVPTSEFIVLADKFAIVNPGVGQHVPFAIGPSGMSFDGFTNWSGVQGRPTDSQILNNLLDPSTWVEGHDDPPAPGFNRNGGIFEQYREVQALPDGSRGLVWTTYPGLYYNGGWGWDAGNNQPEGVAAGDGDGGWDTDHFDIEETKPYRFSVWVSRVQGSVGNLYLGCGANTVRDMPAATVNGNPYFYTANIATVCPVVGRWYLAVGYVYPASRAGDAQPSLSGVYDGTTGQKIASGTDYAWAVGATTSYHRTYHYYSAPNSQIRFAWPRVDQINGSEPSLGALLAMGSVSARNPITASNVTTYIANAAILNAQIGNAAITAAKIANANILTAHIANGQITNALIADAQITNAKIGNAAVNTLQLAGEAVTVPVSVEATNTSAVTASTNFSNATVMVTYGVSWTANVFVGSANGIVTLSLYQNGSLVPGSAQEGRYQVSSGGNGDKGSLVWSKKVATSGSTYFTATVSATGTASTFGYNVFVTALGVKR